MDLDQHIRAFEGAVTLSDFIAVVNTLTKEKKLSSAARSHGFQAGLRALAEFAKAGNDAKNRLLAVATLVRISKVLKTAQGDIGDLISNALSEPLPPLGLLDNANERLSVARSWRIATTKWWAEYLAAASVHEENTAEKVRSECIQGLLVTAGNLDTVMVLLRKNLRELRFETANPGKSLSLRIASVLSSLRRSYARNPVELGENVGTEFSKLMDDSFRSTGPPTVPATKQSLVEDAARLVHEFVRAKFSTATRASTYSVLDVLRSWYKQPEWARLAETSQALQILRVDISEALRLLVQAGVTDDALSGRLAQTMESPQTAREVLRKMAEDMPGLPVPVRQWLLGVAPRAESILATESQQRSVDELLAELLIDTCKLADSAQLAERDVLPQVSVLAPRLADLLSDFIGQCKHTLQDLQYVALKRSLKVRGSTGEELDFSPLEHEMLGGPRAGVRRIRILRPAVEAASADGPSRIVRKALVEPSEINHS